MGSALAALLAAVVVGTWNGNWFPSGRAEHRAHPDVEAATAAAAAAMLADGLAKADPGGTNDVVFCLHEMRGPRAASNLVARIGRRGLRVVSVSGYRRRDRFDQQQDAIATTLPVVSARWSRWKVAGKETPPRGYAFASVVVSPAVTANVYAVHLKSNYGGKKPEDRALNRAKRTRAAAELVSEAKGPHVIVAGDMNADKWGKDFAEEKLFSIFEDAGFFNTLARLPADARGTHPSARYGDSALDYVFVRGFDARMPTIVPNDGLSDHFALFVVVE